MTRVFQATRFLSAGLLGLTLLAGCSKKPAPENAATPGSTAAAPAEPSGSPSSTPSNSMTASAPPAAAPAAPAASAPAPAAKAPAPAPPPPPKVYVVPAGTHVLVRMGQTLSAKTANVGDGFTGTLAQSIVVDGTNVLKAGTPVSGTVAAAKGRGRFKGAGDLGIALSRIGPYTVSSGVYEKVAKGKGKRTATMVGGGAGLGALIGGLAGGGKGALIGGLAGAGAGTAGAAYTGNQDIVIPAESTVTFRLTSSISVTEKARTAPTE